jgi:hypothetical protein
MEGSTMNPKLAKLLIKASVFAVGALVATLLGKAEETLINRVDPPSEDAQAN